MNSDIFQKTTDEIRSLAKKHKIPQNLIEEFLIPNRIVEAKLTTGKKGDKKTYTAFRSQHNNKLGPYKGGLRFHQNVSREEVMALSLWMTIKCAIANLPYGGGKGGIIVDPKNLSQKDLEALSRGYARAFFDVIGADKDIPAPDVNTNPVIIEWMSDEYAKIAKDKLPNNTDEMNRASFTGKPLRNGGLNGRAEATGFGGVVILTQIAKKLNKKPQDLTVAVQGFGNVGYHFALFAQEKGFRVVSVSDSKGAIVMDRKGSFEDLDIPTVMKCKKEKGLLAGCYCVGGVCDITRGRVVDIETQLKLPVDILVPSALENAINEKNMKDIKAKVIIEMANGPVSPVAHEYLSKNKVLIVPDVLANAGGVTGSYVEWMQNIEDAVYEKEKTFSVITKKLVFSFSKIWEIHKEKKIPLKEAAYLFALNKLL